LGKTPLAHEMLKILENSKFLLLKWTDTEVECALGQGLNKCYREKPVREVLHSYSRRGIAERKEQILARMSQSSW
jgi:hypothetical protein